MDIKKLVAAALQAKERSYSPYSQFHVGAALLSSQGEIFTGCNIENASYSPTNCAERTAFFKAVSEGVKDFTAIAIAGGPKGGEADYCYPCGVCRQVMMEFCKPNTFKVYIVLNENEWKEYTLSQLLPFGFSPADLGIKS